MDKCSWPYEIYVSEWVAGKMISNSHDKYISNHILTVSTTVIIATVRAGG